MANQAQNRKGFYPYYESDVARIVLLPMKTSVTIAKGDAVIIDTLQIDIALANSAILVGVAAEASAAQAAGTLVAIWADPNMVFTGRANADSSSYGLASEVDIIGATGVMEIDENASSTDVLYLIAVHQDDAIATAGARWMFRINKHSLATID